MAIGKKKIEAKSKIPKEKEPLEKILEGGFNTWKNNLKISLPFLFSALSMIVIMAFVGLIIMVFAWAAIVGILSSLSSSFAQFPSNPSSILQAGTAMFSVLFSLILVGILVIIVIAVIMGLIASFFNAGAVGMAKEATETGKTSLGTMVDYGKRKFASLFLSEVITSIIFIVGALAIGVIFFALPLLARIGGIGLILLFLFGAFLFVVYALFLAFVFSPVKYALVCSDLGPIEGVKRGYSFFMNNKLYSFLLGLFVFVISTAIGMVPSIIKIPAGFVGDYGIIFVILSFIMSFLTGLISIFVIAPLEAVWWTRFYIGRAEKQ